MPIDFDITAQLLLQAPNVSAVVSDVSRQLSRATPTLNVNTSGASSGFRQLTSNVTAADAALRSVQQQSQATTASLAGSVRVTADFGSQLSNLATQAGVAARRFIAFSVAAGSIVTAVSAFKQGVKAAVDFDLSMNKVAQVSNEAGANIARVRQTISELSTTMGVSSASLAEAAVTIKQAGLSADETTAALKALALTDLAPTFDNMKQSAEGLIAALRQFNLKARDYETVLGSMNAVSAEFAVESADLITAVQKAGGAFKQTGGDLNEFLGLFTSVRATTREGADTIATGLRTIFTRLQRNDTVSALRDLGINLRYTSDEATKLGKTDLTNQFVGAYEAVRRLSEGLESLRTTDPRYSAVIEQLGGYRQISRVIPLLKQFEDAERAKNVAIAGGISLQATAEKRQEALANKIDKLKETYLELFRKLVDSNGFKSLANTAILFADSLAKVLDYVRPLVPLLTTLAGIKLAANLGTVTGNLLGSFSATVGSSTLQPRKKMASGGPVMVPGSGNTDSVPAEVPVGSFVLRKSAVKSMKRGVGLGVAIGGLLAGGNDAKTFAEYDLRSRADRSRKHAVSALLMPGELVFGPEDVKKYGKENLERMNRRGYAAGGFVRLEDGGDPAEKRRLLVERLRQKQRERELVASRSAPAPAAAPVLAPAIPQIPVVGPSEAELERQARAAIDAKNVVEPTKRDERPRLDEKQQAFFQKYYETALQGGNRAGYQYGKGSRKDDGVYGENERQIPTSFADSDIETAALEALYEAALRSTQSGFDHTKAKGYVATAAYRKAKDRIEKVFGQGDSTAFGGAIRGLGHSSTGDETIFDVADPNAVDPADEVQSVELARRVAQQKAAEQASVLKLTGGVSNDDFTDDGALKQGALNRIKKNIESATGKKVGGGRTNAEKLSGISDAVEGAIPAIPLAGGVKKTASSPAQNTGRTTYDLLARAFGMPVDEVRALVERGDPDKSVQENFAVATGKSLEEVRGGIRYSAGKLPPPPPSAERGFDERFPREARYQQQVLAAEKARQFNSGRAEPAFPAGARLRERLRDLGFRENSVTDPNLIGLQAQQAVGRPTPVPPNDLEFRSRRLTVQDINAAQEGTTGFSLDAAINSRKPGSFGSNPAELERLRNLRAEQQKADAERVAAAQKLYELENQITEKVHQRSENAKVSDPLLLRQQFLERIKSAGSRPESAAVLDEALGSNLSAAQVARLAKEAEAARPGVLAYSKSPVSQVTARATDDAFKTKLAGRQDFIDSVLSPAKNRDDALHAISVLNSLNAQKGREQEADRVRTERKDRDQLVFDPLAVKKDAIEKFRSGQGSLDVLDQVRDKLSPAQFAQVAKVARQQGFTPDTGDVTKEIEAGVAARTSLGKPGQSNVNQTGGRSTSLTELIEKNAEAKVEKSFADRGSAAVLSTDTKNAIRSTALAEEEGRVRRELTDAQKKLLATLNPAINAYELNKIAAEQVEQAMHGLVPVIRSAGGKILGLQTTVQEATAKGISAPGAGGLAFQTGEVVAGARSRLSKFGSALFSQNRFSAGADAFASKFSGFGTVAAIGGGFLASQIDPTQESKEHAVAAGNTSGVQARQGAAGGLQGAVVGASIGAAVGSVIPGIGTAIGGAVGAVSGGLYGLVDSLKQAERDIKDVQIGNSLRTFGERLNDANSRLNAGQSVGADTSRAIADEIKSVRDRQQGLDFDAATHTFSGFNADEFTNLRKRSDQQQFGGSIPSLLTLLNKQAEQEGRAGVGKDASQLVSSLLERNGGANRTILNTLASTRGISAEQQQDELVKTVRKGQLSAANEAQNKNALAAETRSVNTFGRLVASVQAAADSLDRLHRQGDVLNNTIEGIAGTYHVSAGVGNLEQLGRQDKGALEPLSLIAAVGGEQGRKLQQAGTIADAIRGALPSVLAGAVAAGPNGEQDFSTTVRQGLTDRLGKGADVGDAIGSVVRQLDELTKGGDVSKVLDEVHTDASKFSDKLASVLTDPVKDAGTKFAGQIEAQANKYVTELNKLTRHTQLINQNFDAIDQLQVQKVRTLALFEGQDTGRANQLLDKIPLSVLNAPFQARQERLTGFRGDAAVSPTALGADLRDTNRKLEEAVQKQQEAFQANPKGDAFQAAAENVRRLSERSANLSQALKNLTDVSGRAAAAQEKLARFQQERDSRLSLAERYATGTPEELGRLNRGFVLAKNAAEGAGNLDRLTQDQRRNVVESLRAAGSATLTGIQGAPRADDLLRKLLENSFNGQFKLTGEQQKDEAAARAEVIKAITDAQTAYAELAKTQKDESQRFFQNLTTQHGQFYARLATLFTQDRLTDKQNALGTASKETGRLNDLKADQQRLAAGGVTTTAQVVALQDKKSELAKLKEASEAVAKENELFVKARKGVGAFTIKGTGRAGAGRTEDFLTALGDTDLRGRESQVAQRASEISFRNARGPEAKETSEQYGLRVVEVNRNALRQALAEVQGTPGQAQKNLADSRAALAKALPGVNAQALEAATTGKDGGKFVEALDRFGNDNRLEDLGKRAGDAAAQFKLLEQQVKQLSDAIAASQSDEKKFAAAIPAVGKAFGGAIFSPKGTDTVPAMLTPKEFVVNAKSAQANLSLLKQINAANGPVYRADGGFVDPQTKALNDAYEQKEAVRREAQRQTVVAANLAGDRKTQADATSAQAANQAYFQKEQAQKAAEAQALQRANEQYEAKAQRGLVAPTGLYGTNGLSVRRAKAGNAVEQGKGLTLDDELAFLAKSNRFGASALYKAKARASQQYSQRLKRAEARGVRLKQSREDFVGAAAARFNFGANRALAQRQAGFGAGVQRVGDEGQRSIANAQFQRRIGETNDAHRQDPESRDFLNRKNGGGFSFAFGPLSLRFASGGVVPGTGDKDSVHALLTPGEGVLTKNAMRQLGAKNLQRFNKGGVVGGVNYLASGGGVEAVSSGGGTLNLSSEGVQAMNGLSRTINQFVQAAGGLGETAKSMTQAFSVFNGSAKTLADALSNMPKTLSGNFSHSVTVVHNGAEIFAKLNPDIEKMVVEKVTTTLSRVFKNHMPEAGVPVG